MLPSILGTDDYHIEDSGELLGEFLSSLSDIESLQTVVFSGHVFHSLTLPAALPSPSRRWCSTVRLPAPSDP